MASFTQPVTAPPEVEATLSRLAAYKNVQGVLILSRPQGIILRSSGTLFALPPSAAAAREDGEEQKDGEEVQEPPRNSEVARRYAKAAVRMVEAVGKEVGEAGGEEEDKDDLRFLRIRTKKHELMITPDEQYILIVVQDPTN
ncbi:hypothetical protein JCM10213_009119 [Rhodosporidiobolus nylandii]